jgi:hypothetical protein
MYSPTPIPADAPRDLRSWLADQLRQIADALARPEVNGLRFAQLAAEPDKLTTGDVVWANGSDWNPGSGAGLYEYRGGAWHKL